MTILRMEPWRTQAIKLTAQGHQHQVHEKPPPCVVSGLLETGRSEHDSVGI